MIRLSKFLSLCGVTSRRGAAGLVEEGRVSINDLKVEKIGVIVDESTDVVKVDGDEVVPAQEKIYILLNKPRRVMTTSKDPFKRKTVMHYLKSLEPRVYPVGRLDYDTEGALILCNDGDLAYRLTHPKYKIEKIYEAMVTGRFTRTDALTIQRGIPLEDGAVGHARADIIGFFKGNTKVRLTLTEGRKREVRQLCKAVGHPVKLLRRVAFAGITCQALPHGHWRELTKWEVSRLRTLAGL
ncbi:MAG TPA: pseudouridine synthase [Candidatus Deferrimicrobium sp.]|nr:pseudouridine synthase [Candidatus Deferrimicrobium sp.]